MSSKGSTGKVIQLYYDYVSPYSYLAHKNLQNLLRGSKHRIEFKPVFLLNLLQHWKQSSPVENEAKRRWIVKDSYRHSSMNSIPFKFPPKHPFNSVYALRASVSSAAGDRQDELVGALFDTIWNPNASFVDISQKEQLNSFLKEKGIDSSEINEKEAKQELENNVQEALKLGVFGVPTMVVDGEVFWGCDQLPYVMEALQDMDPLNNKEVRERCDLTLSAIKAKL